MLGADENIYDQIADLLKTTKDENLKILLLNLQQGLVSEAEKEANTIALQEYLINWKDLNIEDDEKEKLMEIVNKLSNATVISALWWTEYDIAKQEILGILPTNLKTTVSRLFGDFEVAEANFESWNSQLDERKNILQEILQTIKNKSTQDLANQKEDEITKSDLDEIVVPNICKIMNYYNIASNTGLCTGTDVPQVPEAKDVETVSKNKLSKWLKILIITLSSLIWIFAVLVIFFAVKAKINRQREDEE